VCDRRDQQPPLGLYFQLLILNRKFPVSLVPTCYTFNGGGGQNHRRFLEQKYGYYHCKDCNIRWESAYVWCVQGTNKVYFRQFCRTCQKSYNPYRVEDITCQSCKQTRCTCPVKLRHVDPKRPHRQDLCGRCKGKRLSCDSTFSFKYII
uniref:Zygote arrest 1 n=1 Tax=Varanus komodoensis TaxID=61221 RepID=A0A8D2IYS2_VARKO